MNPETQGSRRFYWDESDRGFIADACRERWPQETAEVLHRADLACRKTFIYTHRWDMERCETEVSFPQRIDWTYRHHGDIEWMVMLNRARYMGELGQAYWLTGDEKYATGYIELLRDWMAQNPLTEEEVHASKDRAYNVKDTWRKLDSGIRIANWLKGYYCIRKSPVWGSGEEAIFREAVRLHGMYLNLAYTPHDRQSNWGFLESNGLFQLSVLFPELAESSVWFDTAVERLADMCKVQVFEDGMHNEQCTMYHHEVLHCLFECCLLAEVNEIELPSLFKDTLNRMYSASLSFVQPDGHQPMLGDSDGTDMRDVLTRGAVMFQRGDLKSMGYDRLDYEGIWFFGAEGYDSYAQLEVREPATASIELPQSGYMFMRSGWDPNAHYLAFDAGHMDAIRAHGHDDLLHISLFAYGKEFLTDPGRHTYMENEYRKYFKESLQHNTLSVDGRTISGYVDSWNWTDAANPVGRGWSTADAYDYAEGIHDGFLRLEQPVLVRRQILFVKPSYWVVVDTCKSRGEHEYRLPFHFAEDVSLQAEPDGSVLASSGRQEPSLRIIPFIPVQTSVDSCFVSRHYNQKSTALKAVFRQKGSGLTRFVTVLYPNRSGEEAFSGPAISVLPVLDSYGSPVEARHASAFTIRHGDGIDHILFSHQGPKGYRFAGRHMSGEVLLVRENEISGELNGAYIVKV